MKKTIAYLLSLVMLFSILPVGAGVAAETEIDEEAFFAQMDEVCSELGALELDLIAEGLSREQVVAAMLQTAQADDRIDAASISAYEGGFSFRTAMGGCCNYDYDENRRMGEVDPDTLMDEVVYEQATLAKRGDNREHNVLLVGPWYSYPGQDDFTSSSLYSGYMGKTYYFDTHQTVAREIAAHTGGSYTLLAGRSATLDAVAQEMCNAGVIIFDSHGTSLNASGGNAMSSGPAKYSYLTLSTQQGISDSELSDHTSVRIRNTSTFLQRSRPV